MLVYGALLVVVGITASAQATMVSADAWANAVESAVDADATIAIGEEPRRWAIVGRRVDGPCLEAGPMVGDPGGREVLRP